MTVHFRRWGRWYTGEVVGETPKAYVVRYWKPDDDPGCGSFEIRTVRKRRAFVATTVDGWVSLL